MSTTSPTVRPPLTGDLLERGRREVTAPRQSAIQRLVHTEARTELTIARLGLGLVMLPHALQKLLGWFGGRGLIGTHAGMMAMTHLPGGLAWVPIVTEIACTFALILGLLTRAAALGIITVMIGAILYVHLPNGLLMNWSGQKPGEGFELHLLAITLGLVCYLAGGGPVSIDRALTIRRRTVAPA